MAEHVPSKVKSDYTLGRALGLIMENWQKGAIAVQLVVARAIEKGLMVSVPVVESSRYDLVLDDGKRLLRAQVKWTSQEPGKGSVKVKLFTSTTKKYVPYNDGDFDILLVYVPKIDAICSFGPELFLGKTQIHIRFERPKNNQSRKVLMAPDYYW